jgi:bla regulator protein BlaR1
MTAEFVVNHLWQSSCFVLLQALVAFALRKSPPKVRYWIWLSASLKFLAPLTLLVSLGSMVPRSAPRAVAVVAPAPALQGTILQAMEPFTPAFYSTVPAHARMIWVWLL